MFLKMRCPRGFIIFYVTSNDIFAAYTDKNHFILTKAATVFLRVVILHRKKPYFIVAPTFNKQVFREGWLVELAKFFGTFYPLNY